MDDENESGQTGSNGDCGRAGRQPKKAYETPELIEWGSILDLTQGAKQGFEDFPKTGGTKGV